MRTGASARSKARSKDRTAAVVVPPLAGRALGLGQRALVIGLSLIVLVAFAAGIVEQRWKEATLRAQVAERSVALRAAEERNRQLHQQLAASDPDAYRAYVEDTARRQLSLGYPDETVVLVNWTEPPGGVPTPTSPTTPPPAASRGEPNWQRWLRLLRGE